MCAEPAGDIQQIRMGEEPAHIVVAAVEEGVGLVFIERAHLLAFAAHLDRGQSFRH